VKAEVGEMNAQHSTPNVQRPTEIYLMGLDLGTSAIKGVVMDRVGNVVAASERQTAFMYPREGWVEIDPELHYRTVSGVIRDLASSSPGPVISLAMAAASGNTLLTDAEGRPLRNMISWMDQRTVGHPPAILGKLDPEDVRQIVGWPCIDRFPLAHLAWLKENEGAARGDGVRYCMNTDWLLHRLTGRWVMDHSTATTFHLRNQVEGTYHEPFLNLLGIREDRLSLLAPSGTSAGKMTAQALHDTGLDADVEVVTGCFDHPAAARGMGVLAPGALMLSCGTSWVGFFPEQDRQRIVDARLLCDPFLSGSGGPWGAIFSVPYIGRTIDWYVDHVIAPNEPNRLRVFDESAQEAQPGAGGLEIDLREPPRRLDADRKNVSRAVMEGAAKLLDERIRELAGRGMRFTSAVMVGGPSRSPVWPGIVEAATGLRLSIGSAHAGARGAAVLAGIGVGLWKDEYAFV
jgi:sugar (pentulose or hexulose) kinase